MTCGSDTYMQLQPPLATPPAEPSDGSLSLVLSANHRFPKTSKFTDSFVVHGRWENNTLDAATDLQKRERRLREKTTRKMEQVTGRFHREVEEVERIQEAVRQRQRRIARANLCACCAIIIQTTWRRHHAIAVAWERRRVKLGTLVLTWWRRFTKRRALVVVQRFTISAIRRRVDLKRKRSNAASTLQFAWRRWMVVQRVRQRVMASAATEVVLVRILGELVQSVYFESKALVIQSAWRRSLSRREVQIPKPRRGRFFVTQGNGSSPHRKVRPAGPRFGASSEPSSSPSRNGIGLSPQFSKGTNGTSAGVVNRHPTILGVIASALAAKRGIGETLDEKNWRELPQWNSPLNRETSGVNRFRRGCPAAATAAVSTRRSSQGGRRQSVQRKEIEQTSVGDSPVAARRRRSRLGSTSRPPYATVPSSDVAEIVSIGDCSGGVGGDRGGGGGGGGGGGAARGSRRSTESFDVKHSSRKPSLTGETTKTRRMTQPRRPSMEKRSSLLKGRRRTHTVALEERRRSSVGSIDPNNTTAEAAVPADNLDLGIVPSGASVSASTNILDTEVVVEDETKTPSPPDIRNQTLRNGDLDGAFASNVSETSPSSVIQPRVESSERPDCQASAAGLGLKGREDRGEEYESDSFESEGDMPGAGR